MEAEAKEVKRGLMCGGSKPMTLESLVCEDRRQSPTDMGLSWKKRALRAGSMMEGKHDAEGDRLAAARRAASEEALTALRMANSHVAGTENCWR